MSRLITALTLVVRVRLPYFCGKAAKAVIKRRRCPGDEGASAPYHRLIIAPAADHGRSYI